MLKPKVLTKLLTREHSLFYFWAWHDSDAYFVKKWIDFDVKDNLFLKENSSNKISVWYEKEELARIYAAEVKKINKPIEAKKLIKEFSARWKVILAYYQGKKKINSITDLKKFYQLWVRWWATQAIVFDAIDLLKIPLAIRKQLLKLREKTQEYGEAGDRLFVNFFTYYFPKYKIIANLVTPAEVFSVQNKKFDSKTINIIKKRSRGYGIFHHQILTLPSLKKKLADQNLTLETIVQAQNQAIKGSVAFRGNVSGKVRIIRYKKDINKLKVGEILVTDMTSPDFIQALKKAKAIITNEGGLTCHAAIIARELKKPCIVGTKIATQLLKTGDRVEVNADLGLVKILS
ncbi:MAG: PEP-utilizing enzyme [Candidatus Komeilibacteria bacterium]|nr:PEP-utilizing enzyme [Candidatus Komeilibacteria bacterium]